MGNSTKPRKAYKPVPRRMPIIYGMDKEAKTELAVAPLMAITMFMSGQGNEHMAYTLINSILTGHHLVDIEREFIMIQGTAAMYRVVTRGSYGKWGFSGDDLKEITAAVKLSDELQAVATRRQMRKAIQAVLATAE